MISYWEPRCNVLLEFNEMLYVGAEALSLIGAPLLYRTDVIKYKHNESTSNVHSAYFHIVQSKEVTEMTHAIFLRTPFVTWLLKVNFRKTDGPIFTVLVVSESKTAKVLADFRKRQSFSKPFRPKYNEFMDVKRIVAKDNYFKLRGW